MGAGKGFLRDWGLYGSMGGPGPMAVGVMAIFKVLPGFKLVVALYSMEFFRILASNLVGLSIIKIIPPTLGALYAMEKEI